MFNISSAEYEKFIELRKKVFAAIKESLAEDGHCKHYEGQFTIEVIMPNYFDKETEYAYVIQLDMYLIAPTGRHHEWRGASFTEAIKRCETDIDGWVKWWRRMMDGE